MAPERLKGRRQFCISSSLPRSFLSQRPILARPSFMGYRSRSRSLTENGANQIIYTTYYFHVIALAHFRLFHDLLLSPAVSTQCVQCANVTSHTDSLH